MIQDNQTNMVYLAHGLSHYVPVCRNLLEALHREQIHAEFLPYTSSYKHVWARDCNSEKNKRFKVVRIGEVVLTDETWTKEYAHHSDPMDAFHCFGPDQYHIVLKLNNAARNIMVEEFPMTEKDIKQIEDCVIGGEKDQTWLYDGVCYNLWGVGRFVLGQQLNIEVVECDELKEFLLASADHIYEMYGEE